MAADPSTVPAELLAALRQESGAAPLVVQLTDAVPAPGSRPLLAASVVLESGLPCAVVAIVAGGTAGRSEVDGVPVLTVPVGTAYRDLSQAAALDSARLEGWVASRDRALTLSARAAEGDLRARARWTSSRRSLLDQGGVPSRTTAAEPPTGRWVSSPAAVDLELAVATALDALSPAVVHAYGATAPAASRCVRFAQVRGDSVALVLDLVPPLPAADVLASAAGYVVPLPFLARTPAERAAVFSGPPSEPLPALTRTRVALSDDERLVAVRWLAGRTADVEAVVDALEHDPSLHALVHASRSGAALTALLADAQRRGLRGRLHTSTDSGPATLQGADVTVLTASGDALPVDLLDSVSLGIPVVAASAPTIDALVAEHGFGRTHDGTAEGVATAVSAVLDDGSVRASARTAAAAARPWSQQREQLLALYAGLLPAGSPAPRPLGAVDDAAPAAAPGTAVDAVDAVDAPAASGSAVRLGIGPANYAGQATAWARALRRHEGVDASSFGYVTRFLFELDHPRRQVVEGDNAAGAAQTAWLLDTYTHVLLDGFLPATGGFVPGGTEGEAEFLRRHGRTVGLVCHGTEIRDPDRHMARLPQSYYGRAPRDWVGRVRGSVHANTAAVARLDLPVFVSTPDLLLDVPSATWLPVVVDVDRFTVDAPVLERRVPRVLHSPSRSVPPIKGTEIIEPALRALHEQGLIEYVSAENLPHDQMRDLVASVDIVVDQILSGFYGVAAVEAMAAGRVAVGYVADDVRALMEEPPPVIDVLDTDIAATVLGVLDDRDRYAGIASTGPSFARRWHDGRVSAEVLAAFVGQSSDGV